ncbi:MAG TPA: hypothetical protein VFH48_41785 [Chloroflexota bacterium]|nr:hypothetical protein [Chloroflexota bacterium]
MSVLADPIQPSHGPLGATGVDLVDDGRASRDRRPGRRVARAVGLLVLVLTTAGLAVLDYPIVFGRWESFVTYPMMQGPGPTLTLDITPGGFTFDFNKGRFALIDLGYYTAEWLGWSLAAYRLPALVAGAVSVLGFFVIASRAFGFWAGQVGALALALNPMFLLFWHQLIVSTITLLFLVLVIERYQNLELAGHDRRALLWAVPSLALAFVFLLIHHGPGRAYGGALMAYWAANVAWRAVQDRHAGRPVAWEPLLAVPAFGLLVIVMALLLDARNARYLTAPIELLVVQQSEFVKSSSQFWSVLENVPVMLTAVVRLLNLAPEWFGEYSSDVLVDFRYHLVPTSLLPLFLVGLIGLVARIRRSASARLVLFLLGLMFVGPLFSSGTSISEVRMIYTVIPLYLCVAAGAAWLLARRQPAMRYGAAGLLVVLVGAQAISAWAEMERHRAFVDDLVVRWSQGANLRSFEAPGEGRERAPGDLYSNGSYRYYIEVGGVPALALAQRIKSTVAGPREPNEVVLISLDGAVQRGESTGSTQLVFFLRQVGLPAALYDSTLQQIRGAGPGRPSCVIADNSRAAAAARRLLEADGRTVVVREVRPSR